MSLMASQITSLTIVYSTVYSVIDLRKHQSSASLAFVWGIHRDRWIPRTKGQLRGKCFHLMTSSSDMMRRCPLTPREPLWLILISVWIFNYINYEGWDGSIYPIPNFNGAAVEIWEWISNFILHLPGHVITYIHVGIKVNAFELKVPCCCLRWTNTCMPRYLTELK